VSWEPVPEAEDELDAALDDASDDELDEEELVTTFALCCGR
jgi:hypothetical protein